MLTLKCWRFRPNSSFELKSMLQSHLHYYKYPIAITLSSKLLSFNFFLQKFRCILSLKVWRAWALTQRNISSICWFRSSWHADENWWQWLRFGLTRKGEKEQHNGIEKTNWPQPTMGMGLSAAIRLQLNLDMRKVGQWWWWQGGKIMIIDISWF